MASTKITKEDVVKIAKLSKMTVTGEEERFVNLFNDTLEKIDVLNELDTSKVAETFQVTGLTNVFQRPTFTGDSLTQAEALSNAKEVRNNLIVTKNIFLGGADNES
jgi:aspartyl/glutamyl-tRNA(Asn/Gln) amidotransferase C subunit